MLHVFTKTNTILRSKHFRSSYCVTVGTRAKQKWKKGVGKLIPLPLPLNSSFLLSSQLSRRTHAERLVRQARVIYSNTCCGDRRVFITALYQVLSSVFSAPHSTPGLISLKGVLTLFCEGNAKQLSNRKQWRTTLTL